MDGLIGEVLNLLKVPPEYRIPAIVAGLLLAALLVSAYRKLGFLIEWIRQKSFEHIDVQLNTITRAEDGTLQLRWSGVGKLKLHEVAEWAHLAHLVRRAATRTTEREPWVVLESVCAHNQFMGQLLSSAGALPTLVLYAQKHGFSELTGVFVSEDFPGIPARLKFFIIPPEQLSRESVGQLGRGSVEAPSYVDRITTWRQILGLMNPNEAFYKTVPCPRRGWRRIFNFGHNEPRVTVVYTLRVSIPQSALPARRQSA